MSKPPLFTPVFFTMCGFTFTVFLSAFLLLPTVPLRVLSLGGSSVAAGLFLGLMTYASALSAPLTGAFADRFGRRRMLVACSVVLAAMTTLYGFTAGYRLLLALAVVQGVFWSGLLAASAAYITGVIPDSRRAEGIGYWGLSTMLAVAVAPSAGLWLHGRGWGWLCAVCTALNLAMAAIAATLREQPTAGPAGAGRLRHPLVEWRVLVLSVTLFLYSFGYGGITSFAALYGQSLGVRPPGLYFTALSVVVLLTRPFCVPLADRVGSYKVLLPCLFLIAAGLALLSVGGTWRHLIASAALFGAGFGTAYPVFAAHVTRRVSAARRGAAFGAILAAFDTGIGTGSICAGWLIGRAGFGAAFGVAAALAALAIPYFLLMERRWPPEAAESAPAGLLQSEAPGKGGPP